MTPIHVFTALGFTEWKPIDGFSFRAGVLSRGIGDIVLEASDR